jgi:hypothetical protein
VRTDRPDDGDPVPDQADTPHRADAQERTDPPTPKAGQREPAPALNDAAARAERSLEHRGQVDAAYRAHAIDQGCARVEKIEATVVTPAMRAIEAEDPGRHLAGLGHRLKERYRIEEKVNHDIEKRGVTATEAFTAIKDAIRYTYCYPDDQYSSGVQADCERIKSAGFELVNSRNWWPHDEYKGLNSWWRVPHENQVFEVQFHTRASLEAKEETHAAYERLRTLPPDHAEVRYLRAFQREVTAKIPIPPGALDISIS